MIRRRKEAPAERRPSRFRRFRARHPHLTQAATNTAALTAVVAPLALSARKDIRPLRELAKKGLTSKLGRAGRSKAWDAAERAFTPRAKAFRRKRNLAWGIGVGGGAAAVGGPVERYGWEKRQRKKAAREVYEIPVVSRKTGKTRVIYGVR